MELVIAAHKSVAELGVIGRAEDMHRIMDAERDATLAYDPAFAGTMTMTWEVTAVEGGTRIDIVADDVPDGISAEDHATGLASSLTNLAEHLER